LFVSTIFNGEREEERRTIFNEGAYLTWVNLP